MNILVHDTPVWLSLTLSHRCSSCTVCTKSRATVCWSQWNSWTPHSPLDPRSAGRGASRWTRKGPSSWPREKCLLPLDLYPRSNSSRCHRYLFRKKMYVLIIQVCIIIMFFYFKPYASIKNLCIILSVWCVLIKKETMQLNMNQRPSSRFLWPLNHRYSYIRTYKFTSILMETRYQLQYRSLTILYHINIDTLFPSRRLKINFYICLGVDYMNISSFDLNNF